MNNHYISSYKYATEQDRILTINLKKINPYEIVRIYNFEFAVHKIEATEKPFRVTCLQTGCCVAKGNSKWEAEQEFQALARTINKRDLLIKIVKRKSELEKAVKFYE
jgi:hypothetical protein